MTSLPHCLRRPALTSFTCDFSFAPLVVFPNAGSWHENPVSAAAQRLRELIVEAFIRGGSDFSSGRRLPEYLRSVGIEPQMRVECLALEAGHPYLHLPVQFATSLKPRLLQLVDETELSRLMEQAASDLASPPSLGHDLYAGASVGAEIGSGSRC